MLRHAGRAKTDPEEVETNSSSGRKKRRKNRKKKRSTHAYSGDECGAFSDETMSLYRALSSSNVSTRTSGGEEVSLHMEDDDEFPDLVAARQSPGGWCSHSSGFSYSDALKTAGSSMSRSSNNSPGAASNSVSINPASRKIKYSINP